MRIAYLIAVHAFPELLVRLIQRLRHPQASFFVHVDRSKPIEPFLHAVAEAGLHDAVAWAPRVDSAWGTLGQVEASLSLMRTALAATPRCDRLVLLSGQDYPLRSAAGLVAFFEASPQTNFMECQPLPLAEWEDNGGWNRVRHFHFTWGKWRLEYPSTLPLYARRLKLLHTLCERLLPRERALPATVAFHGGSNWWNLTREAAEGTLRFLERNPRFRRPFRWSRCGDELFFQTVMRTADDLKSLPLESASLRCFFWDGRDHEYPTILRGDDYDRILAFGALFARKMHPTRSLELLDRIDREHLCNATA